MHTEQCPITKDTMISRFVIIGSGGGGRTAASIIESWSSVQGQFQPEIMFLDDADKRLNVNGYPVIGPVSMALDDTEWPKGTGFVIAFGSLHLPVRERVFRSLQAKGRHVVNAIHPGAFIDRWASLGTGNVISANCVIHPNAKLGNNCFLCVAATVDHDDALGDNIYLSPGVHLAGDVILEDNVFVGTNAAVLPGVHVGRGAIIGAGAVVINDVAEKSTVFGVPARPSGGKLDRTI
jgi:sugar O-acyltransferase (sialic acid O-acetyltransferase NeuD family)